MKLPSKTIERGLFARGYTHIVAVDEVGMGCLAGPVVVCATVFERSFFQRTHKKLHGLRDSKLLLPHQRALFSSALRKENLRFELAYSFPKTIDKLNIYQAARRAMKRAVEKLGVPIGTSYLLIDGDKKIHGLLLPQQPIIKGDRKVFSIACSSVLAKVFRDRMMDQYAKKFPGYGFEKHKGYSTKLHQAQLAALGPSPIHRRSFSRVGQMI
jgi:ribonuclease HII